MPRAPPPARRWVSANRSPTRSVSAASQQHFEQHLSEMLREDRIPHAPPPATRQPTSTRPPPSPTQRQLRQTNRGAEAGISASHGRFSSNRNQSYQHQRHSSPPLPSTQQERHHPPPEHDYSQRETYTERSQSHRSPRPAVRSLATDSSGRAYLVEREPSNTYTDTSMPSSPLTAQTAPTAIHQPFPILRPTTSALTGLESQQRGRPFAWRGNGTELRAAYISGEEYAMRAAVWQRQQRERERIKREQERRILRDEQERAKEIEQQHKTPGLSTAFTRSLTAGNGTPTRDATGGRGDRGLVAGASGRDRRESQRYWDTVIDRND